MDIKKYMILIKGEDRTSDISSFSKDLLNKKVIINFHYGYQSYSYNQSNVVILQKQREINLDNRVAYIGNMPIREPKCILDFGKRIRVIHKNGTNSVVSPVDFQIIENDALERNAQYILEYLQDIAQYTNDSSEEQAFLKREMSQLTFVHPESVLAKYLLKKPNNIHNPNLKDIIFPFSFNISQKKALEQALQYSISVVQGPPGTGKTQTILNILTNLVVKKQSVAVVSNNNEAVKNVMEKLQKKGYDFLTAFLGNMDNQKKFFENMPAPNVEGWECEKTESELLEVIQELNNRLVELMNKEREKAQLEQELRAWKLEEEHFEEYYSRKEVDQIVKLPLFCRTPEKIISFLAETSVAKEYEQTEKIIYRLKLLFKFGIFNVNKLNEQEQSVLLTMQKKYYQLQIGRLEQKILKIEEELNKSSFEELKIAHQEASENFFRKYLYKRYSSGSKYDFTIKNYKNKFEDFIEAYPILLSTTYALRRSIPQDYLLDYVIIDESSQVDLITGVLVFSCCKNVIIVGDLKQLPQIIDEKIKNKIEALPPEKEYDYFLNNILSSVVAIYEKGLPLVTLREHYRCHPQIIEFCNQKYYDGQLIAFTKSKSIDCPLILYKTSEGNHMRRITHGDDKGVYNQRELDVIVEEILKNPEIINESGKVGIITPYRKQANKAGRMVSKLIESDTVHKYQGREKETIILSTVLDSSWYGQKSMRFVDNPQMVNVAVSRAISQFVLVTDHNLFFKKGEHIGDLIRYMQYSTLDENIIESQIVSVFDLLYQKYSPRLLRLKAKMNSKARYQSEEALRVLLEEILEQPEFSRYRYSQGILLQNLLKDTKLLTKEEKGYVINRASLDFVVFYKQDKSCALVIEVDGFAFHENCPKQLQRDAMKDNILKKYDIPFLRLATNGSQERKKIEEKLRK